MTEHLMSIDRTLTPKKYKDIDAQKLLAMRLILMEPGLFETHPEMGVGLVSKYRYKDADTIKSDLPDCIRTQLKTYLPQLTDVEVSVQLQKTTNGEVRIIIGLKSNELSTTITVDEESRELISLL